MTEHTTETTTDTGGGTDIADRARELITGVWAGQALHAGVGLGLVEAMGFDATPADELAADLDLDPDYCYRLLRALGSLGVANEDDGRRFSLTPLGALFQAEGGMSLRDNLLLAQSPTMLSAWTHLPDVVREGGPDGFVREFGVDVFGYGERNPEFGAVFDASMTASSTVQTAWVLDALGSYDLSGFSHVCDVGGGHGYLLCSLLASRPHLEGTVLERPGVIADEERLWASELGVEERCTYTAGDMFEAVPSADAYLLKMILHDWTDDECVRILSNLREAASPDGRVFVCERVVPGPEMPHFSKIYDINMMISTGGRERTDEEYRELLERAGWEYVEKRVPEDGTMSVIEGRPT